MLSGTIRWISKYKEGYSKIYQLMIFYKMITNDIKKIRKKIHFVLTAHVSLLL